MRLREATSFCRICIAACGVKLTIDENDKIVGIRGDREQPMSRGYACFKGLQAEDAHHGSERLLHPLKRRANGSFERISLEQALDEIAVKMRSLIERYGPDSIGLFAGNGSIYNAAAYAMHYSFMAALGSPQHYTTVTIDQSAKLVSFERMGGWAAGVQGIDDADVFMVFGSNPLVSHNGCNFLVADPTKRLKEAKARGLKLIVVDPRNTETARHADLLLQPIPGQDAAIAAGMIRLILEEGWEDRDFCHQHVTAQGLAALRRSVDPFTSGMVTRRAGLEEGQLRAAAQMFARDGRRGSVITSTGPNMAASSNVAQHLVDCINVICGRFRRAGDPSLVDMLSPDLPVRAEVIPPPRSWQHLPPSRIRGVGGFFRERMTGTLPEEILTPGKGQIRCLLIDGGNPAVTVPDQRRMVDAMRSLELSVAIEPYMTVTARLSDYILPPKMQYERPDLPLSIAGFALVTENWVQYTEPLIRVPPGSELVNDWYVFWALAKHLGLSIVYNEKVELDMEKAPTTEELLAIRVSGGRVSLEELKRHPSGKIYNFSSDRVSPARPEADAKFDVMPEDVAEELRQFLKRDIEPGRIVSNGQTFTHLLSNRRMRDMYNSIGTYVPRVRARTPYNPAYLNPQDLSAFGIASGDRIEITSDTGRIVAVAEADETVRPGVLSIAHAWGGLPDDQNCDDTACVSLLINSTRDVEVINAMPRMSGIPVNIRLAR